MRGVADIGVISTIATNPDMATQTLSPGDEGATNMLVELHQQFDVLDLNADLSPYDLLILPDEIRPVPSLVDKFGATSRRVALFWSATGAYWTRKATRLCLKRWIFAILAPASSRANTFFPGPVISRAWSRMHIISTKRAFQLPHTVAPKSWQSTAILILIVRQNTGVLTPKLLSPMLPTSR
jgi:hypothetical protein